MKHKLFLKLFAGLLFLISSSIPGLADSKVKILAKVSSDKTSAKATIQLKFQVQNKEDNNWYVERVLDPTQGAPFEKATYLLKDEQDNPVPFLVTHPSGTNLQGVLVLNAQGEFDSSKDHQLRILANKLFFKLPDGSTEMNAEQTFTIHKDQIERAKKTASAAAGGGETSLALLGGTPGGVLTAKLNLDRQYDIPSGLGGLKLDGQADVTLSSADKEHYFNDLQGELSAYYANVTWLDFYKEASIHGRVQSDQSFDLVDSSFGVKVAFRPRDPVTEFLGTLFPAQAGASDRANALFIFGYDYVQNVRGDTAAVAANTGVNTSDGTHQGSAILRLRIPILRDQDFSFLPALGGKYNVDLEADLKGVYDSSASKFLDQSRVTLAFTYVGNAELDKHKPSLIFSWQRGKEGPTYQQISSLLAGLRLSF